MYDAETTTPTRRVAVNRRSLLALAGAAVVPIAGCSSGGDGNRVEMTDDFEFEPASVTIDAGETLTWENVGSLGHTVTAYGGDMPADAAYFASGGFDSEDAARSAVNEGIVEAGETYERAFEVAGTYEYFCIPHEGSGMKGTVRVRG
jgi:plastocyanin